MRNETISLPPSMFDYKMAQRRGQVVIWAATIGLRERERELEKGQKSELKTTK